MAAVSAAFVIPNTSSSSGTFTRVHKKQERRSDPLEGDVRPTNENAPRLQIETKGAPFRGTTLLGRRLRRPAPPARDFHPCRSFCNGKVPVSPTSVPVDVNASTRRQAFGKRLRDEFPTFRDHLAATDGFLNPRDVVLYPIIAC